MKNLSNINIKSLSKKLKIKGGLAMLGLSTIMSVTACSPKTVNNNETTKEEAATEKVTYVQTGYDGLANNINDDNVTEISRDESTSKFVDEIVNYSKGESKNHTSMELTSGASLVMGLLTTDGDAYLATTGLVNNYLDEINNMNVSNIEDILGILYSDLNKPIKRIANKKPMLLEKVVSEALTINKIDSNTTTEEELSVLDVERFSKLVDEIMEENKELGFNVRKESIEALLYVCNMSMATAELSQLIESRFASEDEIINSVLETINSYDMNMVEAWRNNSTKHADLSKLFLDEIDKDAISYVQTGYDILANNINDNSITEASRNEAIGKFMDEIIDYSLYNGKINGYTDAELTSGVSLGMSLLTTDGNSYLSKAGLVNNYQNEIDIMSTKDMEIILSQLRGELNVTLNSKSSLEECFEKRKSYTK